MEEGNMLFQQTMLQSVLSAIEEHDVADDEVSVNHLASHCLEKASFEKDDGKVACLESESTGEPFEYTQNDWVCLLLARLNLMHALDY
jgi:hypothetical protein